MVIKAVIFDIGGVCVSSPMQGIYLYELKNGLPQNYINVAIVSQGEDGAFQRLERGELTLEKFYPIFGRELSNPANKERYYDYLRHTGKAVPNDIPTVEVDGRELFRTMMAEASKIDQNVFQAIKRLKATGRYKIAALTNNFRLPEDDPKALEEIGGGLPAELRGIFDYFIESHKLGLRKPDPAFYRYACVILNITPDEAVFLDDVGANLRSARSVGMKTIKVHMNRSKLAIQQLEKELEESASKL